MSTCLTHYVVVRADISAGLKAACIIHAAGESSTGSLPRGTFAVALQATPEQLAALAETLSRAQVPHAAIHEPDAPFEGALMAIGIRPVHREEVRKYVSCFPLVK